MRLVLKKNDGICLRGNNQGKRLKCAGGILWVTQAGDQTDYFLLEGEEFIIHSSGTVIIEARKDAMVALEGIAGQLRGLCN